METNIIKENNKLIAEFMGFEVMAEDDFLCCDTDKINPNVIIDVSLKYNSDWNQLMEVIDRIEKIDRIGTSYSPNYGLINVIINKTHLGKNKHNVEISFDASMKSYKCISVTNENKIDAVYLAVIEFLKWYNNL